MTRIIRVPDEVPSIARYLAEVRRHWLVEHGRTDGVEFHLTASQAADLARECSVPSVPSDFPEGMTGAFMGIPFVVHEEPQPQCATCWLADATPREIGQHPLEPATGEQHLCPEHQAQRVETIAKMLEGMLTSVEDWPSRPPEPTREEIVERLNRLRGWEQ